MKGGHHQHPRRFIKTLCRALALVLWLVFPVASARAQPSDREEEVATALAEARFAHRGQRADLGVALLTGGGASVLGGAVAAVALRDDPFTLAFGLGTAVWGTVNGLLSLGLFDLSGAEAETIRTEAELRGDELAQAREAVLRAEESSATFFVFNLGLDFFYIGTGILLAVVASQLVGDDEQFLRGYGIAQSIQGGFLLAFDFVGWWTALERADDVAAVPRPSAWDQP